MEEVDGAELLAVPASSVAFFMESRWIGVDRSDRAFSGVIRMTLDSVFSLAT